jgi:phytoene dehydrogenase-like protein
VDAAPPIFSFPAPWRDLFRKSGRALEAEFARNGEELIPAGPARHLFDDGTEFTLPIGRGDQHTAITDHFGRPAADRWRDLVDGLGEVWQALRPLGVEADLSDRSQLSRTVKKVLQHRDSVADLARRMDHPVLSEIIIDLARLAGSDPARTPAFVAVQLYLDRTFGRWTAGSSTTMITSLEGRLRLRKVDTRTGVRATAITVTDQRVTAVHTDQGSLDADAVLSTCDPVQLYAQLLPRTVARRERRRLARLRPALAPTVVLQWLATDDGPVEPTETVRHRAAGGPRIDYIRRVGPRLLQVSHDYGNPRPDPGAGLAWRGFGSWLDRPPISSELTGLFTAGPFSRGGHTPSAQILSGALGAYAAQQLINPAKPLEPR